MDEHSSMDEHSILHQKCISIYDNLLDARGQGREVPATAYIREFMDTARCDSFHNLSEPRSAYERMLNATDPQRLKRVMDYKETDQDEKVAAQAALHYHNYHNKVLADGLPFPRRVWHKVVGSAEPVLALVGIATAVGGGGKAALASYRMLREKEAIKAMVAKMSGKA